MADTYSLMALLADVFVFGGIALLIVLGAHLLWSIAMAGLWIAVRHQIEADCKDIQPELVVIYDHPKGSPSDIIVAYTNPPKPAVLTISFKWTGLQFNNDKFVLYNRLWEGPTLKHEILRALNKFYGRS